MVAAQTQQYDEGRDNEIVGPIEAIAKSVGAVLGGIRICKKSESKIITVEGRSQDKIEYLTGLINAYVDSRKPFQRRADLLNKYDQTVKEVLEASKFKDLGALL